MSPLPLFRVYGIQEYLFKKPWRQLMNLANSRSATNYRDTLDVR